MKTAPDRKFFSEYALKVCHEKLRKNKESFIISSNCFWHTSPKILEGLNFERYTFDSNLLSDYNFSPTFQVVYKELITAIQCNDYKYTDEIIFVGMPWELDKANKYFGDNMLINAYDY